MLKGRGEGRHWVLGNSRPASGGEAWADQGIPWSVGEDVGAHYPEDALFRSSLYWRLTDGLFYQGPQAHQRTRGKRERVTGRRAALLAQDATEVWSKVQWLRGLVEVRCTGQAGV